MRKNWNKPMCTTLFAKDLSSYIKAAANSGQIYTIFVLKIYTKSVLLQCKKKRINLYKFNIFLRISFYILKNVKICDIIH